MSKHYLSISVAFNPDVKEDAGRYWGDGAIKTFKISTVDVDAFWNKTRFSFFGALLGHPFVHPNQITLYVDGIGLTHFTGDEDPPTWGSRFSFFSDSFLEGLTTPVKREDKSLKVYLRRNVYDSLSVSGQLCAILCKDSKDLSYIFFCSEAQCQDLDIGSTVSNGPDDTLGFNIDPIPIQDATPFGALDSRTDSTHQRTSNGGQVDAFLYASTAVSPPPDNMGGTIPGARIPV